ncbi:hypothetical protein JG687_00012876 [Phytophthora cactorum]|uniref:Uncharacterized protein n=1 Tax=Phytophthora cactorum TaxID=29920 RepID=A0A8T1U394_9STRA|nr:hypothetical protein JG687_00012876 [Phytophthora cactorum]
MLVAIENQAEQLKQLTRSVNLVAPTVISLMKSKLTTQLHSLSPGVLDTSISRALNECGFVSLLQSDVLHSRSQPSHNSPAVRAGVQQTSQEASSIPITKIGLANSRLTRVHSDFEIPSMTLKRAWGHWCCGHPSGEYGSYRFLEWQDFQIPKSVRDCHTTDA